MFKIIYRKIKISNTQEDNIHSAQHSIKNDQAPKETQTYDP